MVSTEYIFVEKAPSVCLKIKWFELFEQKMGKLAYSFVKIGEKFSTSRSQLRAVFTSRKTSTVDSKRHCSRIKRDHQDVRFCIGPITDYMFWYGRRAILDLCCGPCLCFVQGEASIFTHFVMPTSQLLNALNKPLKTLISTL